MSQVSKRPESDNMVYCCVIVEMLFHCIDCRSCNNFSSSPSSSLASSTLSLSLFGREHHLERLLILTGFVPLKMIPLLAIRGALGFMARFKGVF